MPDKWTENPPAPCHRTGKQEPNGGPYFVEDHYTADVKMGERGPQVLPRIRPLVHSASFIKRICDAPGSPWVAVDPAVLEGQEAQIEAQAQMIADLEATIDELRGQIETMRSIDMRLDADALAERVVIQLEDRLPKRPGPKPKAAA